MLDRFLWTPLARVVLPPLLGMLWIRDALLGGVSRARTSLAGRKVAAPTPRKDTPHG